MGISSVYISETGSASLFSKAKSASALEEKTPFKSRSSVSPFGAIVVECVCVCVLCSTFFCVAVVVVLFACISLCTVLRCCYFCCCCR